MSEAGPGAPRRALSVATKTFYGFGSVAEGTKNTAFNVFLLFYYNQVLGLSGTLSGAAIFLALCVDAVTDPMVGILSDRFHSRWGRRHPFMYSSALPMAACFVALFHPPEGASQTVLFAWLAVFAVGVRTSMTLYMIPSSAMVPELTPVYDERTVIVGYRHAFGWIGGITVSQLGYLLFFAPTPDFTNGQLDPAAYGPFAWACAAIVMAGILMSTVGTHHVIPRLKPPPDRSTLTWARVKDELRPVLANRSYRVLLIGSLFSSVAGGFSDVVGLYMNTYFWGFTMQEVSRIVWALVIAIPLGVLGAPLVTARTDKKTAALGMATVAILGAPLPVFLRLLGLMPENGDPWLLPLIAAHACMLVTLVIAIGITIGSMIADTVDENELETGLRQEGLFTSAIAFTVKATSGIGSFLAGIALDLIAFPRQADPTSVPPEKLTALGLVVGPGLMGLYVVTLFFLARYRITRTRHREILEELERRRVAGGGTTDSGGW